ncbi:DNA repair protein RadC [Arachidicoccus ginsenosidivorans]|jgi:DNA repair protein RadC|uniref:DNA repair protein RadC n=1 Tax=Arachidicoccus ginsenosidivorans TaxID=496057 RepID=A0A5B8VKG6_9BACT|nr:DNA repair protein RadC [Arachidicoccus ginsenosidivorans]QEC71116.1 DNA repair protein RadC [Arachidicoccus ginsenosidivorans]
MQKKKIKEWALDDRPREKLITKGATSLSNAELLAILINTGSPKGTALDVAKALLDICGNKLHQLARLSVKEIMEHKIPGIGLAKAVAIHAALSLSARKELEDKSRSQITCSRDMADFLIPHMAHLQHEVFMAIYLNSANHILHHKIISTGGLTATSVDVRVILKTALQYNAVAMVVAHNHPSGSLKPSPQDQKITESIRAAAKLMEIIMLDHIIVSDHGFFSFLDNDLLE